MKLKYFSLVFLLGAIMLFGIAATRYDPYLEHLVQKIGLTQLDGFAVSNPIDQQVLLYDAGTAQWINSAAPGASGEANTASNSGAGGVGPFLQKTGVDIEFKNINAASNRISVVNDGADSEIDIDVVEANLALSSIGGACVDSQIPDTITIASLSQITTKNHSALTLDDGTNPHGTTKSDVGLGSVEDTALSTWTGSGNITTLGTISSGSVPWAQVDKTTSSIADITTRSAGDLSSGNLAIARMPVGGTWTLSSGLTLGGNQALTCNSGTIDLNPVRDDASQAFLKIGSTKSGSTNTGILFQIDSLRGTIQFRYLNVPKTTISPYSADLGGAVYLNSSLGDYDTIGYKRTSGQWLNYNAGTDGLSINAASIGINGLATFDDGANVDTGFSISGGQVVTSIDTTIADDDTDLPTAGAVVDYAMPLSYLDTDSTLSADSDAKVASQKAVKAAIAAGGAAWSDYAHYEYQLPANNNGGTMTSGSWLTVPINTTTGSAGANISRVTTTITLQAGTYYVEGYVNGQGVDYFKSSFYNTSDSAHAIPGANSNSASAGSDTDKSIFRGFVTVGSAKNFEVQVQCATTCSTTGYGSACNFGAVEVFAGVTIRKIQ